MTADEIHKMAAVEASHWWYVGTREICLSLLLAHLNDSRPLRILDIGCGTGGNMAELARLGPARGIDLDPLCVDYTRRRGLQCSLGDMLDFDAPPASLDLITFFDVATHLGRDPFPAVLKGASDALAPGGVLAFREPAMPIARGSHDRAVDVRHRFTVPDVRRCLKEAGFEPLRITYLNTVLFPPIVLLRQLQNALAPTRAVSDVRPTREPLNTLLLSLLRIEKKLLRFIDLPFGVSLFAVARKRAS
ncbi:MAG: class I SAM-dependent methyltransferase [Acidobacteria bacterium]|nr:class I SAM-dependent methyltransferase [Acidobacteriota bacterium]